MIASVLPQFRMSSSRAGTSMSTRVPGVNVEPKSKSSGSTPVTTYGDSLMVTDLPTMAGSAPNRRRQSPAVSIVAPGPFDFHSSPAKPRPSCGLMPSCSRNPGAICTPTRRSGSPDPDIV